MSTYKVPDFSEELSECEYDRLRKYCVNASSFLLSKYGYSEKAVRDFLSYKKHIPNTVKVSFDNNNKRAVDVISSIVAELKENGLIDDKKHVHEKAESLLLFKKKSVIAARTSLLQKGFEKEDIDNAIRDITHSNDYDEQRALVSEADKIVRRSSFKNKDVHKRKSMFISNLVSKGFSLSDIAELLDEGDYEHLFEQ